MIEIIVHEVREADIDGHFTKHVAYFKNLDDAANVAEDSNWLSVESPKTLRVFDSVAEYYKSAISTDEKRRQALAKLTEEDRRILGLPD